MLNLKEQRQIESHAKDDDRAIVSIRLETFSELLGIVTAVVKNQYSEELFELLADVEIGDES